MFCAECGKTIAEGVRFCASCGAPTTPTGAAATQPPAATPAPAPQAPIPTLYTPAATPSAPAGAYYGPQGPAGPPPRRKHEGLIPGLIAAMIIVLAGLGVGLFFGLKGNSGDSASTTATDVAVSTTFPPTTLPPATDATVASTDTTLGPTTTEESTTTTEDVTAALAARAGQWMDLLEAVPTSDMDLTDEIAAFLTPKDQAQARAAQFVQDWSEPGDPDDIIETDLWRSVPRVILNPDGSRAMTVAAVELGCRDGLTTRGLEAIGWQKVGGEWLRPVAYEPPPPVAGPLASVGDAVVSGYLLACPMTLQELKHLSATDGPTASGMFLAVEFYMRNESDETIFPGGWNITAVDAQGHEYGLSADADDWWYEDVEDRAIPLIPGESTWLWYTFEVPEGLDLLGLQFRVDLPSI